MVEPAVLAGHFAQKNQDSRYGGRRFDSSLKLVVALTVAKQPPLHQFTHGFVQGRPIPSTSRTITTWSTWEMFNNLLPLYKIGFQQLQGIIFCFLRKTIWRPEAHNKSLSFWVNFLYLQQREQGKHDEEIDLCTVVHLVAEHLNWSEFYDD
mgnify:CR=1 FL=1